MTLAIPLRRAARLGALPLAALGLLGVANAAPAGAATVSSNWAGYVASPASGSRFGSVSGSWTEPAATCSAGRETYSAAWVGLGGDSEGARALEQTGTDADCTRGGRAVYSAWYELIPAGPVKVALKVHPGDTMTASVTVRGRDVTLRLRDLTTGARYSATRKVSSVDTSSAEWIVEAPSVCSATGVCGPLALTDFGTVAFSLATATAAAHTGPADDPAWSAGALELRQNALRRLAGRFGHSSATGTISAIPSALTSETGAFTVAWEEASAQSEQPAGPTLPGGSAEA
jgi:Peptidase A4 family